jgi:hypothetical protein
MIESADINDSDILNKTVQEWSENGRTFRLKFVMPSGQPLVSEQITQEDAKKALKLWCEQVRVSVAADVKETARQKGEAARRKQLDEILKEPAREQDRDCKPPLTATEDPVHHAKNQVALLESEVRHWTGAVSVGQKHLEVARDKLRKWQTILASFEASGESNGKS